METISQIKQKTEIFYSKFYHCLLRKHVYMHVLSINECLYELLVDSSFLFSYRTTL